MKQKKYTNMAYRFAHLLGYEPVYLNEEHKNRSESCLAAIEKLRQQPISRKDDLEQMKRNEELLQTHPMYSQKK